VAFVVAKDVNVTDLCGKLCGFAETDHIGDVCVRCAEGFFLSLQQTCPNGCIRGIPSCYYLSSFFIPY